MFYFLNCVAGCSLVIAVWVPARTRYPLTVLRAVTTVVLLGVTALGIEVLHRLGGLDEIDRITADAFARVMAR